MKMAFKAKTKVLENNWKEMRTLPLPGKEIKQDHSIL